MQVPKVSERVPFPPLHAFEQSSTLTHLPEADLVWLRPSHLSKTKGEQLSVPDSFPRLCPEIESMKSYPLMQRHEESATENVRKLPTHLHMNEPSVDEAYAPQGLQPLYPVLSLKVSEGHSKH